MASPLVSVMMPYYNALATLPRALASMLAQTYQNWECLLIDDGSSERPDSLVDALNDPRIRLVRFAQNQGRAAARQAALDAARGEFLTMLDADDWIYPERIARQLELFNRHPELGLISGSVAIVNFRDELQGVRRYETQGADVVRFPPQARPGGININHAPSMVRMSVAKAAGYDTRLRSAEDFDFLLRIALRHSYGVCPEIHYAYKEDGVYRISKILANFKASEMAMARYREQYPVSTRVYLWISRAKRLAYRVLHLLGQGAKFWDRRNQAATTEEARAFAEASAQIEKIMKQRIPQVF